MHRFPDDLKILDFHHGSMFLASVKRVSKSIITVQLPGFASGIIKIDQISKIIENLCKLDSNAPNNIFPKPPYNKIFKKDMLIACIQDGNISSDSFNINLSIDPIKINSHIKRNKLSANETLWGCVCSSEDHGYAIDFGIPDIRGFYKTTENLPIGYFSFFTINSFSGGKKVAIVSQDHKNFSVDLNHFVNSLLPGNIIYSKISKIDQMNITVEISSTLSGNISLFHSCIRNIKKYSVGESIFCRIICINPNSKYIQLTLNQELLSLYSQKRIISNYNIGDKVACQIVEESDTGLFALIQNSDLNGFIPHAFLENSAIPYKIGATLQVRIFQMNLIDGVVVLSNNLSFMNEKYVNIKQLSPGLKCDAKVSKVLPNGYQINISPFLTGFIYKYLSSNNSQTPIDVGTLLKCRIIHIDEEKNKIILTSIPSMVHSSLPILDSYEIASDSFKNQYLGFVEKCEKSYCIIKFFNNVSGLLHKNEISNLEKIDDLTKIYQIGTILNVSILSCEPTKKRIVLSLKNKIKQTLSNNNVITLNNPEVKENIIKFPLSTADQAKYLCNYVVVPISHLSDFPENCLLIENLLKNQSIYFEKKAVFFGIDVQFPNEQIASFKYSILRSVELDIFPSQFGDVNLGQYLPGFISKVTPQGINVRIGLNVTGFLPRKKIGNEDVFNLEEKFSYGQSGVFYVEEIDVTKNRIILSLDKSSSIKNFTYNIPSQIHGHGLLLSYLKDFDFISSLFLQKVEYLPLVNILHRGNKIYVKIKKSKGDIYFVNTTIGGYHGTLLSYDNLKISSVLEATLIHWSWDPFQLYFIQTASKPIDTAVFLRKLVKVNFLKQFDRFAVGILKNGDSIIPTYFVTNETVLLSKSTTDFSIYNNSICCICQSIIDSLLIVTPLAHKSIGVGSTFVNCTITNILSCNLKVITDDGKKAYIHATNISSTIKEGDRPLERFNIGDKLDAFVYNRPSKNLKYLAITHNQEKVRRLQLSLKPFIDLTFEKIKKSLNIGETVIGFIKVFGARYVSIEVSPYIIGILSVIDLNPVNDSFKNPIEQFPPGTAISLHTHSFDAMTKLYRFSRMKSYPDIMIGDIITGRVYKHNIVRGILVDFPNYKHGNIALTNTSDEFSTNILQNYPVGSYVSCKVIDVADDSFSLSTRASHFSSNAIITDPVIINPNHLKINSIIRGYITKVAKSHIYILLSENVTGRIKVTDAFIKFGKGWNKNLKPFSLISVSIQNIVNEKIINVLPYFSSDDLAIKELDISPPISFNQQLGSLKVGDGFDWNSGQFLGVQSNLKRKFVTSEGTDISFDHLKINNSLLLNEKQVRSIENKLSSNKMIPVNSEDFDRLIVATPNSSILWVNYMAFYLQSMELDKARSIGERSLKSICYSEEKERLNIWMALINIESLYGTMDSLIDIYEQAKKASRKKKIIQHIIELWDYLNKHEHAERECLILIKTFPRSKKSYVQYAKLLSKLHRFIEMKQLLNKALQNIPEKKHVDCIVQFSLCEFNFGDAQRGATFIESILKNYPSRVDIWSVYIDQLIKHSDVSQIRNCFERVITLNLKRNKIQTILNKYLTFESKHGTPESIARINQLMLE